MRALLVSLAVTAAALAAGDRRVVRAQAAGAGQTATGPLDQRNGSATVRGSVVEADSGQPLRRASVYLFVRPPSARDVTGEPVSLTTTTDAQGQFEFTRVPAGTATVNATKDGYYDAAVGWNGAPARGPRRQALTLAEGQVAEKIAIALSRAGAIVGRVVDEFGDPAASIAIEVLTRVSTVPDGAWQTAGRRSESDDTGVFRVWGLPPGEYLVAARPRQIGVEGRPGRSTDRDGFAPTYYPGTSTVADAGRVLVRAGRDTSGVTFPLLATRLAVIRGQVVGIDARTQARVTVMVSRIDRERLGSGATGASAGADGVFEVTRVPPGRYRLTAREGANGPWGAVTRAGSAEVDVDGADVDGVTIPLGPGGSVSGRVVDEHGQPVRQPLQVQFAGGMENAGGALPPPRPVTVGADGTFTARGLFGALYVRLLTGGAEPMPLETAHAQASRRGQPAPLVAAITAVRVGDVDMLDRPIPFDGHQTELVIEVATVPSQVSGTIAWPRANRAADARRPVAIVFPEDPERWHEAALSIGAATASSEGTFAIRYLPPGDRYLAVAVDGLAPGAHRDRAVLAALAPLARPLRIDAGGRHEIALSAVAWPLK